MAGPSKLSREKAISSADEGELNFANGNLDGAKKCYSQAIAMIERLLLETPRDLELRRDFAIDLSNLARVWRALGDLPRTSAYLDRSYEVRYALAKENPDNLQFQVDLASVQVSRSEIDVTSSDYSRAAQRCQDAIWIAEGVVNKSEPQRILSRVYSQMGDIRLMQDKTEEALSNFTKSIKVASRLASSSPEKLELRRDHAVAANKLGDVHRKLGDFAMAWKFYKQSLQITKTLSEDSLDRWAMEKDLAYSYCDLGDISRLREKFKAAIHYYEHCLKIRKRLLRLSPKHLIVKWELASILKRIALTYVNLRDFFKARRHYAQAIRIFKDMRKRNHPSAASNLADCYEDLAEMCLMEKRNEPAIDWYKKSLRELAAVMKSGKHGEIENDIKRLRERIAGCSIHRPN